MNPLFVPSYTTDPGADLAAPGSAALVSHLEGLPPFIAGYGYGRRALYRTTVVRASSGVTQRNAHWAFPLHVFSLPLANRLQDELDQIVGYFHAAGGRARTFDFLDRFEDRSCGVNQEPAADDVLLATATAGQTDVQIIKTYTDGYVTQVRKITRPVAASLLVAVNGVAQTVNSDFLLLSDGVIRFTSALEADDEVTAGFRFHVPVAFASDDVDITVHNRSAGVFVGDSVIELEEVR